MTVSHLNVPDLPGDSLDFIARLSARDRDDLLRLVSRRDLARNELIFKAGSPGAYVYFLESGRVKVYHLSATGKEILLWFCFPGEIFGLAEVCHGGGRQVYAEATRPARVLGVTQEDFTTYLSSHPAAALLVNDVLACRLRNLGNIIQSLVANDVNERVMQLLVRLAASHGKKLPGGEIRLDIRLTHQEMANMIGTTRQSVTSALSLLRRLGAIEIDGSHRLCIRSEGALDSGSVRAPSLQPSA